jgi:5-methylcytosine-specific restriction protein A
VTLSLEQVLKLIEEGKFYKSTIWEKKRLEILQRDNFECQICKEEGGFAPATTVHHILHLENRPDLALDDDNLLSVCAACHNREHPEKLRTPEASKRRQITPERW